MSWSLQRDCKWQNTHTILRRRKKGNKVTIKLTNNMDKQKNDKSLQCPRGKHRLHVSQLKVHLHRIFFDLTKRRTSVTFSIAADNAAHCPTRCLGSLWYYISLSHQSMQSSGKLYNCYLPLLSAPQPNSTVGTHTPTCRLTHTHKQTEQT